MSISKETQEIFRRQILAALDRLTGSVKRADFSKIADLRQILKDIKAIGVITRRTVAEIQLEEKDFHGAVEECHEILHRLDEKEKRDPTHFANVIIQRHGHTVQ